MGAWEGERIYCLFGRGMEKKKKGKGGGDTLSPTSSKSKYREKEEGEEKEVIWKRRWKARGPEKIRK